jgi:hypothetical protein
MDLLSRTFEKVDYIYEVDENGEKVFYFRTIGVKINTGKEMVSYYIHRCAMNRGHMIERVSKLDSWFSNTRYKIYSDDKSFENAIKRIEKMAQKSQG